MQTMQILVTPEIAGDWLKKNTFNRSVSMGVVKKYATDMATGKWRLNHQGIAFDNKGTLVDGQHRLLAIIESNVSVPMLVTYGSDRVGIDELRVRSKAAIVKFGGLSDWIDSKDIQTANAMIEIDAGAKQAQTSAQTIVEFCELHREAILFCRDHFKTARKGISTAIIRGAVAIAYPYVDKKKLARFVEVLYSGMTMCEEELVIIRLRDHLIQHISAVGATSRRDTAHRAMRAIKAHDKGENIRVLHTTSSPIYKLK